jgi:hypothetical protein
MDKELERVFTFTPNTREQDESLAAVYAAAKNLAEVIQKNVPAKHGQQAILQLAQTVQLCRQGIEVEATVHKPLLVTM